ncbi:MAG: hypothetical protein MH252_06555 [Thermosynechococcaceae cyanobacterium MS004]|jgi:hypothetical protein|nr:hypothetical protein [Thermosynechococcaceae cyanobacterium MS004]
MNTHPFRFRSKTSLALSLYCLTIVGLILLAQAQVSSMKLFQSGQTVMLQ